MKIDEFKAEASSSTNKTVSPLSSNNYNYSYNEPSVDIIKWPLLKSPNFHSHASQFTKHISAMTLERDTVLKIQKWLGSIRFALFQSLSINKSCPIYKKIKVENYDINKFLLLPDTHSKYATAKENYESF